MHSYPAAIKHFGQERKWLLPAAGDTVVRYLMAYAGTHKISTLTQRLAALAGQGFKKPLERMVLRGIVANDPAKQRQTRPLKLNQPQRLASGRDGCGTLLWCINLGQPHTHRLTVHQHVDGVTVLDCYHWTAQVGMGQASKRQQGPQGTTRERL